MTSGFGNGFDDIGFVVAFAAMGLGSVINALRLALRAARQADEEFRRTGRL